MTMREGGILPPSPWKEAVRRGGGSLPPRDERECETALSRIVIPSAVEGSFSFSFSGAGMYNKKNLYMLFLCVP